MGKLQADRDYPLAEKHPEYISTPTGKNIESITLESVISGEVTSEDCKITEATLQNQADIAESAGRPQMSLNFKRAAELTNIPDNKILKIYNILRPYRSTLAELMATADELERLYHASMNASFIREAAVLYEKKKLLKGNR